MHRLRSHPVAWLLVVALALLAGCASFNRVTLSASEVQALIDQRFPQERRLLEVIDVTIAAPRTRLLPERNRVAAVVDLQARDRVFGASWKGRLDFDAALRWNAADQTLRLSAVRVQELTTDGTPRAAAERLAAAVAERLLEDLSLYQLSADRAAQLRERGLRPAGVTVTGRGIELAFEPISR